MASRAQLKTWFETNDKPIQSQYYEWIDSFVHKTEDPYVKTLPPFTTAMIDETFFKLTNDNARLSLKNLLTVGAMTADSSLFYTTYNNQSYDINTALKDILNKLYDRDNQLKTINDKISAIGGGFIYIGRKDFNTATPTQADLTAFATAQKGGVELGYVIINDFDQAEWYYDGSAWDDMGKPTTVPVATSSSTGIVQVQDNSSNWNIYIDNNIIKLKTPTDLATTGDIPTELPNPQTLTIKRNGVEVATYDGSEAAGTTANITMPEHVTLTQAEYEALASKAANTYYYTYTPSA